MTLRIAEALSSIADLASLSGKTGIPLERLQELIRGADASMREVRLLSDVLKVSLVDLGPMPKEAQRASVLFRAMAKKKQVPVPALLETLSRKMGYALELLEHEESAARWWSKEFSDIPKDQPEAFAFRFRQLFWSGDQVSPLLSLPTLLVDKLQIVLQVINTPHVDGASAYLGGIPFIFVAARYTPRMLFTCAHELGHLLAHHDPSKDFASIDAATDIETRRSSSATERFAHAFASALLIPRAGLGIVLKKVREIAKVPTESPVGDVELLYVARIFGVSFEVAARRCEDVELMPRGGAASLNDQLKGEYGSAEKRADALGLPQRAPISFPALPPSLIGSVVERIRRGELSIGRASMMLGLSIADLLTANTAPA